jgi:hypothetical protein
MLDKTRIRALPDDTRTAVLVGLATLFHTGIVQEQLAESQTALAMGNPNESPETLAERILHHRRATAGLAELLDAGEFAAKEIVK